MSWTLLVAPALQLFKGVFKRVGEWSERRDTLAKAKLEAEVANWRAKSEIAAYKVKADIEWDLKWADSASGSWKDEYLLILWTIPVIGLFIPVLQDYIIEGFKALEGVPQWYLYGFGIIFSATFGIRKAADIMFPNKLANLTKAYTDSQPDVPREAAYMAQRNVNDARRLEARNS